MLRVVVDTREQDPWRLPFARLTRGTIGAGDYHLRGDAFGLVIERKSVEDLFGTVTRGADRFERELERLALCEYPVVIVEGTAATILGGARFSGANGSRVLGHALRLCVKHGVSIMFCTNRQDAEQMAGRLLAAREEIRHGKTNR